MFLAELFSFTILTNGHDDNLEKCISVLSASSLVHLMLFVSGFTVTTWHLSGFHLGAAVPS